MTDLGHSKITELDNDLIEIICKDDVMYDVAQIKENHSVLEKISEKKGEPVLVFSVAGKHTGLTSEASNYLSKGPHKNFIKAEAFVIQSTAQRLVANLYLRLSKPVVPAAYFKNVADAKRWLKGFRKFDLTLSSKNK
jgi:hypothetical protein